MVRFNLWPWANSLRVWKAAITKKGLSYSNEAVNTGVLYLQTEVGDALSEVCEKKKNKTSQGFKFQRN